MDKSKKFWDKASKNYDKTEERFEYIHSKSRASAKKYLADNNIVLDYGCGTGTTSCELANQVKEIHAIDISSNMIEIAKKKAEANNIRNVDFLVADIFNERYKKDSFDRILAFNMLHTIPNPQNVIQRINELLKPDGLLIAVTPCLGVGLIPVPIRRLKSSDIDALLAKGNFQTVSSEKIFKGASSYFIVSKKIDKV